MNIFKSTFRYLGNKPIYSLITFSGFVIGIASALLVYLWVFNELNHDKFHPNHQQIYRVLTLSKKGNSIVKSANSYRPIANSLKANYPQIENACYISFSSETSPLKFEGADEKIEAAMCWSNPDFFEVFQGFEFLEGDKSSLYLNPDNVVLSEEVAIKLFGNKPALGQTIVSDKYIDEWVYTVAGVVRIPKNSHIDFGFMIPNNNHDISMLNNDWRDSYYVHTYITLAKNAEIDEQFLDRVSNHISRYSALTDKLLFQPLADIHLHSDYENNRLDRNVSSIKYVWIFSSIALLIILMACFNFSLLSTARSSERAKEIGVKKVNGASKYKIFFQFIGESVLQTFLAAILALFIVWLVLPFFNHLVGYEIELHLTFKLIFSVLGLVIITGIIAGSYPSFYLSSLKPERIFKGKQVSSYRLGFVRSLVVIQLVIAISFMISTSFFLKQLNYIKNKDLGFNQENIVVIPTGLWYGNRSFKNDLLQNPNVLGVSAGHAPINFKWIKSFPFKREGKLDSLHASLFWVDEAFAETYQLQLVKGKFLNKTNDAFWKELNDKGKNQIDGKPYSFSFPIVINESAEKKLGFSEPIGERIGNSIIVGVVEDFHFQPLHETIKPLILTNDPQAIGTMNVKIANENKAKTLAFIRDVYKKHRDDRDFSYTFFDDLIKQEYSKETRLKNLTLLFSILAILIAVFGILGIAWFTVERRIKEIGVRKVNGANAIGILFLLTKDFVFWVLLAFVIASPVAFYAMNKWLENFAYKTELSWWIFALSGLLALGIALLTVSFQSYKAATQNPVEALRYE